MKGVPKYFELRKQGVEPMEALKQAGATAHDSGMSGATLATGAGLAGNVAGKLMGGGGAAAEPTAGAEQPVQPGASTDSSYVKNITRNPDGSVRHYVGGGMRSGVDSMIDDFEESILPRPGWANKKVL
jgi:hypothetical protein